MVKYQESELDKVFHALSDSTRRAILARLANGDAVVSDLAKPFEMSLPAISKHLSVLEKAGLLQRHKDGRIRRCELIAGPLETASEWIGFYKQFWNAQLDSLADYLEKNKDKTNNAIKKRK
ncbi:MAG: ArsR/SmtB family transcription factor [Thiohalomonadales bacterium]